MQYYILFLIKINIVYLKNIFFNSISSICCVLYGIFKTHAEKQKFPVRSVSAAKRNTSLMIFEFIFRRLSLYNMFYKKTIQ